MDGKPRSCGVGRWQLLFGVAVLTINARSGTSIVRENAKFDFYVAGSRFHAPITGLKAGDAVKLVSSGLDGKLSYRIELRDGRRLGYVPKKLVPAVHVAGEKSGQLIAVDYGTVPWKRYRVTIAS